MKKPAPLLIHIGYHKSASTVLQDQVFARDGSPCFMLHPHEPRHRLVERFVVPAPLAFDSTSTRRSYRPFLEQARSERRTAVLSHERFSGYPPSGGYDSTIIADRLHRTFPEAKILMVFREQFASIISMYLQYITDGGHLSLRDYLYRPQRFLKRMPVFATDFYCYDRLYFHYCELFGAGNVLALPFEQLESDPPGFLNRIAEFAQVPLGEIKLQRQNVARSSSYQILLQRHVNRMLGGSELMRGGVLSLPRVQRRIGNLGCSLRPLLASLDRRFEKNMRAYLEQRYIGLFAESNARLDHMIGEDLAQYGYQMAAEHHDGGRATEPGADCPLPRGASPRL
jgi:hypothetical protein